MCQDLIWFFGVEERNSEISDSLRRTKKMRMKGLDDMLKFNCKIIIDGVCSDAKIGGGFVGF